MVVSSSQVISKPIVFLLVHGDLFRWLLIFGSFDGLLNFHDCKCRNCFVIGVYLMSILCSKSWIVFLRISSLIFVCCFVYIYLQLFWPFMNVKSIMFLFSWFCTIVTYSIYLLLFWEFCRYLFCCISFLWSILHEYSKMVCLSSIIVKLLINIKNFNIILLFTRFSFDFWIILCIDLVSSFNRFILFTLLLL